MNKLMRKVEIEQTEHGYLLTFFTRTDTSWWVGKVKNAGAGPADIYHQRYEDASKYATAFMLAVSDDHAWKLTRSEFDGKAL